jgi:hypothetical protein
MIQLTPEQRDYKEKTLSQLQANQALLEASLGRETRPEVVKSIEEQLHDIEAHISRLQDELAGNVVFDEPIADELFKQAIKALANEKFYLAKKCIHRLETIEPFHPALDRLRREAESGQVSRRTRSIAAGTATSYPGVVLPLAVAAPASGSSIPGQAAPVGPKVVVEEEEPKGWFAHFFQFHIIVSCLVIVLLGCVLLGMFGVTILQWLIESV